MKYGIDINKETLFNKVKKRIQNSGNGIIDMTKEKTSNQGEFVFRKALLANSSEIDFYIAFEFVDELSEIEIYFDDIPIFNSLYKELKILLTDKCAIRINNDLSGLYLVKNIKALTMYVRFPNKYENEIIYQYSDKLIDLILQ